MGNGNLAEKRESRFSYSDYLQWTTSDRYELHEGLPVLMSPAPGERHQSVTGALFAELRAAFKAKGAPCRVFIAPFDLVLPKETEDEPGASNVVQPDIFIVCDEKKITSRNCLGAPDIVIEVLSPSTALHDQGFKYDLYEKSGVREYWIVDPSAAYILRHMRNTDGRFARAGIYSRQEHIPVTVLGDDTLDLSLVFEPANSKSQGE